MNGTRGSPNGPAGNSAPFQRDGGDQVIDMGAKLGRTFAAERAQDSVNLFEATAAHARHLAGAGKRVLFASWSEGSSERLGVMLADHGLKDMSVWRPIGRPPRRLTRRRRNALSCRWRPVSRPTTWR